MQEKDKHEISCRTINTIMMYVQNKGKDLRKLLKGLPYDEKYLTNTNNWISRDVEKEICRRLRVMFDDDNILFKIALETEKLRSLGFIDHILRLMGKPQFIIKQTPKLNKYFTKVHRLEVIECSAKYATIRYFANEGYRMSQDDCCYTSGILTVFPRIWGSDPADVKEEFCSVPIQEKGVINGRTYTVDEEGNVFERTVDSDSKPKKIGRLNKDNSFKLGGITYGASSCLYHISWSPRRFWIKRFLYSVFKRPKVLKETIDEMQRQNDIIQAQYEELYQKSLQLQKHYIDTINALIRAIDAKDHYTEDHSLNVSYIAESIAENLDLGPKKVDAIKQACKLHDLGKIGIKDSILLKPGKLTDDEWKEMKKHPILGAEIIKPLTFLSEIALLIRQDHERWDGGGYPDGLKGDEIDVGARVIMLADSYDAMISGRVYRGALSKEEAIQEIKSKSGLQFDPKVVEAFLKVVLKDDDSGENSD